MTQDQNFKTYQQFKQQLVEATNPSVERLLSFIRSIPRIYSVKETSNLYKYGLDSQDVSAFVGVDAETIKPKQLWEILRSKIEQQTKLSLIGYATDAGLGKRKIIYKVHSQGQHTNNLEIIIEGSFGGTQLYFVINKIKENSGNVGQQPYQPMGQQPHGVGSDPRAGGVPVKQFIDAGNNDTNGQYVIANAIYKNVAGATFKTLKYYNHKFEARYFALEVLRKVKFPAAFNNDDQNHVGLVPAEKLDEWQAQGVNVSTMSPSSAEGKAIKTKLPKEK